MTKSDPIARHIQTTTGQLCTAYFLIGTVETLDGESSIFMHTQDDQTATTTLGLIETASAIERFRIAHSYLLSEQGLDEDDD